MDFNTPLLCRCGSYHELYLELVIYALSKDEVQTLRDEVQDLRQKLKIIQFAEAGREGAVSLQVMVARDVTEERDANEMVGHWDSNREALVEKTSLSDVAGDIYLMGGFHDHNWLASVEVFNPLLRKWRNVAPMGDPRSYAAASVLDRKIFVFGGGSAKDLWYDTVEMYNPHNDKWIPVCALNQKRGSLGGAVLSGKIYAVGGGCGEVTSDVDPFAVCEILDPHVGRWVFGNPMQEKGCRYFTKINLKFGYHQIAVRPEDRHKTAFQTRYGLYEFVVMPFGPCNAPGTFQHAMNKIFHDYLDKFIVVYLDDILIFSRTVEEHAEHLKTVLGLLRQHQYKVNLEICEFGRTKILYLDHEISADGLRPDDAKVASIRDWPRPQTVTEVRSFLGMTGYYRPFVKNYNTIASPLTDLTRLDTPWEWTEECEASFKKLKYALTRYEVLKLPDPDKPFVVTTNASQYGIGAAMLYVLRAEQEAVVKEWEAKEDPLKRQTLEEEKKLEWKLRLTREKKKRMEETSKAAKELEVVKQQRAQMEVQPDWQGKMEEATCNYCAEKGHIMRFCQLLSKDEKEGIIFTTIRGEVFDYEGNLIDPNIEGGMRKEAFCGMGRPLPATFRIASPEEARLVGVEEAMASLHIDDSSAEPGGFRERVVERAQTITRRLARCRDSIIRLCVDMEEVWPGLPNVFLFGEWGDKREDASGQAGTSSPRETSRTGPMVSTMRPRPVLKRSAPTVAMQIRMRRRNEQLQKEREPEKAVEEEPIPVSENDEDNEDEKLRAEEEERARRRALEREPQKGKAERDLVTLKEILAVSSKIREEFKQRMTRKRVMTVKLGEGIPPEANWSPPGTKMDWRSVSTGHMKVQIGLQEYSTLVDDGAEMNIIHERHAIEAGLKINRDDYGFAARVEHWRKLVRKGQKWEWVPRQQAAVEDIKTEFREGGLILRVPFFVDDEKRPLVIETDAGPTALGGGVLIQKDAEGQEIPLRFESRTLNVAERNYSQFKKETLVGLYCFRIFRNYVFGRRFILWVDPTALAQSLRNYSPVDPTIARWLTYIWVFDFKIERISGSQNRADGLSRVEWDPEADQAEESVSVDAFLKEEESRLSINALAYLTDAATRHRKSIWNALAFHEVRPELVVEEPFIEEDRWGEQTAEEMMRLALIDDIDLMLDPLTIEQGHTQADDAF
ncbi:hypothetical protein CBR_g40537 [Chara braunii]|uniref:Reverse transcriptase domain-containing protein n=1 Tax=Chara braunii TaxID=69332 RepID=A0A388K217_CHABU|nr:hypothetical protein CBR_g40537 [Chara braunii]|eukprot:GBG64088.1 hypothetical protein CBR_g40537 [Chara braunii]